MSERDRLAEYRSKRDFTRTPEPSGRGGSQSDESKSGGSQAGGSQAGESQAGGNRFVVQRHRARRRHYDLRLELGGALLSWAVPKGPTLDPKARHLAVHVEDHPLEYVDFEGVIPEGEYGAGDVVVWDRGTWEAVDDDPARALADGNLHFDLRGDKLAGRFVLVLPRRASSDGTQFLLLHKDDEHAVPGWDPEQHPRSVKSGRTNEEVAAAPEAVWRPDLPPAEAEVAVGTQRKTEQEVEGGDQRRGEQKRGAQRRAGAKRAQRRRPSEGWTAGKQRAEDWPAPTDAELVALDEIGDHGRWEVGGREVRLTNLDKVLFPAAAGQEARTKRDIVRYHAQIAPTMLPYLVDRPLNLHRFPNGVAEPGFWHKAAPDHAPDWVRRWRDERASEEPAGSKNPGNKNRAQSYLVADSVPSLVWLANYAAVELHPWTAPASDVDHPGWVLFDIDPGAETTFEEVLALARLHRTALEHLGVQGCPKVTGQRGIQVWVPIAGRYTHAETRQWAEKVSRAIGNVLPDLVSWSWQKSDRGGRARLDYTQNASNKTLVAPYSARARPGAPVSVPISWDELDDPDMRPDRWTIRTAPERVAQVGDPLAAMLHLQQELPDPD